LPVSCLPIKLLRIAHETLFCSIPLLMAAYNAFEWRDFVIKLEDGKGGQLMNVTRTHGSEDALGRNTLSSRIASLARTRAY
jgi:hypothetical protein